MASIKKSNLFETDAGALVRKQLEDMMLDDRYMTSPTYNPNTVTYPDHMMPFDEKHVAYLRSHPAVDPMQYVANLRLITKLR